MKNKKVKMDHRSKMKNLQKWIITQYVKVTEKSQQTTAKTEDKTVILFLCMCVHTHTLHYVCNARIHDRIYIVRNCA